MANKDSKKQNLRRLLKKRSARRRIRKRFTELTFEALAARILLAGDLFTTTAIGSAVELEQQIVHLNFRGQDQFSFDGPEQVTFDVPEFDASSFGQGGNETQIIASVLFQLDQIFPGTGVEFVLDRPSNSQKVSTIHVGGDDSAFHQWGRFDGLAEQNDIGNKSKNDEAVVFADFESSLSIDEVARRLAFTIQHETKRLVGDWNYIQTIPWHGGLNDVAMIDDDSDYDVFVWPTLGNNATSYEPHGTGGTDGFDYAIDINQDGSGGNADLRKPIYAPHDGVVNVYPPHNPNVADGGYGYRMSIESEQGFATFFAHLDGSKDTANEVGDFEVVEGQFVRQGDLIAYVGDSGTFRPGHSRPDNTHLHFEYFSTYSPTNNEPIFKENKFFSKGFFNTVGTNKLTDTTVLFETVNSTGATSSNVVAFRPLQQMPVFNAHGFDWNEEVEFRIVNEFGQNIRSSGFVTTNDTGQTQVPVMGPLPEGFYFLNGRENDRNFGNSSIRYPVPWKNNGWEDGDAQPLTFVVSRAAPQDNFAIKINELRASEEPWEIINNTLLVAGFDGNGSSANDRILFSKEGNSWQLDHFLAEKGKSFLLSEFDSVFIDAGSGDDIIDARELDVPVFVYGREGNDVILGGSQYDVFVGGDGDDWIEGGLGRDWLLGGKDSDVIFGETSSPPSGFQASSEEDFIFGEDGNDKLFIRFGDDYHGGNGIDDITGQFGGWNWSDVPIIHGGGIVVTDIGGGLHVRQENELVLIVSNNRTFSFVEDAFNAIDGIGNEHRFFGSSLQDSIDLSALPGRAFVIAGPGNDVIAGTQFRDVIFGGSGTDHIDGLGGADSLFASAGNANILLGGDGHDSLFGSGGGDFLHGSSTNPADREYFVFGNSSDTAVDADSNDILSRVEKRRQERLDQRERDSATVVDREPKRGETVSTSAPGITEFTISNNSIPQGEGFVVTVRTERDGTWARLTLYADINQNGRFDKSTDVQLLRTRGRTLDYRGQVRTSEMAEGTYQVRAKLEAYDGTVTQSDPLALTITAPQAAGPPSLPTALVLESNDALLVVAHKDGDAEIPNNRIDGPGQIDLFELTVGTTGNHGFTSSGIETIKAIYDANGNRIGDPVNGQLTISLTAGETYFLAISARFASDTGNYDLHITGRNQISNGTISTPAGNYAGTASGNFAPSNTIDYWTIHSPLTSSLLSVYVSSDPGLDLWVRVSDTNNNVIGFANLGQPGSSKVLTNLPIDPDTTYHITTHGLYGNSGNYNVTADFYQDDVGLPDTINTSTALSGYQPLIIHADGDYVLPNQSINTAGQFRYFHIAPVQTGTFILRTTGTTDTLIGVYSGNGAQLLAFSDNDADGVNGQVELELPGGAGQEYWLLVRGVDNTTGSFGVEVFGPDQFRDPMLIGGLGLEGSDTFSLGITADRQKYFSIVAPTSATSVSMDLSVNDPVNRPMDLWMSIEDEAGNIIVIDSTGLNADELLSNFAVNGGQTYLITITSKDRARGSGTLTVDFAPDSSGTGEFVVNSTVSEDQSTPRVAMNSNGRSVVVWNRDAPQGASEFDNDIYFQIFQENGTPLGTEIRANASDGQVDQFSQDVGIASDGTLWISWFDPSQNQVIIRKFNSNGSALTGEINAGFGNAHDSRIAVQPSGSFLVLASDGDRILARTFSSNGVATSPLRTTDDPPGGDDVLDTAISVGANGGYVASWTREASTYGIIAQRLDATANKTGTEVQVFSSANHQLNSAISANSSDSFAVSFYQNDVDGTGRNIYLAVFDSSNQPIGSVVRANEYVSGSQEYPSVQIKEDGSSVVSWTSGQDGSGKGIYFRQYDAFNNPFLSSETQLNEYTDNDQERAFFAGNGNDTFMAVWESYGQDGSVDGVVGHRLSLPTPDPAPQISVQETVGDTNDGLLPFGRFTINDSDPNEMFEIENTGSAELTGQLSFVNGSVFSIVGSSSFALQPGEMTSVAVSLTTSGVGIFGDQLQIANNAGDTVELIVSGTISHPADTFESNDTDETATDLGIVSSQLVSDLTLHEDSDIDWYRFEVDTFSQVDLSALFLHSEGNIDLIVYDNNLGILAVSASQTDNESAFIFINANEPVFVRVAANGATVNSYSLSLDATPINTAPELSPIGDMTIREGFELTFTANASDGDQPANNLSYSLDAGAPAGATIHPATGVFSWTPAIGMAPNTFNVTVRVTDNGSPSLDDFETISINVVQSVVARHIFYNHSQWDLASSGLTDSDAIAPNKSVLREGETATFANYTSYIHGVNGLIIDVIGDASNITADDFEFKFGNVDDVDTWAVITPNVVVTSIGAGGVNGSNRVVLEFDNGAITGGWLQVRMLANSDTGLPADDVFYFGSAIGETGNSTVDARVDLEDLGLTRVNQTGFGSTDILSVYDVNRDTRVDLVDVGLIRSNQSGFTPINLITPANGSNRSGAANKGDGDQGFRGNGDDDVTQDIGREEQITAGNGIENRDALVNSRITENQSELTAFTQASKPSLNLRQDLEQAKNQSQSLVSSVSSESNSRSIPIVSIPGLQAGSNLINSDSQQERATYSNRGESAARNDSHERLEVATKKSNDHQRGALVNSLASETDRDVESNANTNIQPNVGLLKDSSRANVQLGSFTVEAIAEAVNSYAIVSLVGKVAAISHRASHPVSQNLQAPASNAEQRGRLVLSGQVDESVSFRRPNVASLDDLFEQFETESREESKPQVDGFQSLFENNLAFEF